MLTVAPQSITEMHEELERLEEAFIKILGVASSLVYHYQRSLTIPTSCGYRNRSTTARHGERSTTKSQAF